jgi:hypothetical protein
MVYAAAEASKAWMLVENVRLGGAEIAGGRKSSIGVLKRNFPWNLDVELQGLRLHLELSLGSQSSDAAKCWCSACHE